MYCGECGGNAISGHDAACSRLTYWEEQCIRMTSEDSFIFVVKDTEHQVNLFSEYVSLEDGKQNETEGDATNA